MPSLGSNSPFKNRSAFVRIKQSSKDRITFVRVKRPVEDCNAFSVRVKQSNSWSLRCSGILSSVCWSLVTPFRDGLSVPHSRVKLDPWTAWPLKIGNYCSYQPVQCNAREERSPQLHCGGNLKFRIVQLFAVKTRTLRSFESKALCWAIGTV